MHAADDERQQPTTLTEPPRGSPRNATEAATLTQGAGGHVLPSPPRELPRRGRRPWPKWLRTEWREC
eukprot:12929805-Prorocentrum_lima.AAC.1